MTAWSDDALENRIDFPEGGLRVWVLVKMWIGHGLRGE